MVKANPKVKQLKPWLQFPFFKQKCGDSKHAKQYTTIYCMDCMQPPSCKLCWDQKSKQHQHHQVLKVCIASKRTAVNVGEISKYMDVSHIQNYIINGHQIIYLNTNDGNKKNPPKNPCQVCKKSLTDEASKFCSISCKISTMEVETNASANTSTSASARPFVRTHRKRTAPVRSPLF